MTVRQQIIDLVGAFPGRTIKELRGLAPILGTKAASVGPYLSILSTEARLQRAQCGRSSRYYPIGFEMPEVQDPAGPVKRLHVRPAELECLVRAASVGQPHEVWAIDKAIRHLASMSVREPEEYARGVAIYRGLAQMNTQAKMGLDRAANSQSAGGEGVAGGELRENLREVPKRNPTGPMTKGLSDAVKLSGSAVSAPPPAQAVGAVKTSKPAVAQLDRALGRKVATHKAGAQGRTGDAGSNPASSTIPARRRIQDLREERALEEWWA